MRLRGDQYKKLKDALKDAFDLVALKEMLEFEVGKDLEDEGAGVGKQEILFNLIKRAQQNNWLPALIEGAIRANGTDELKAIWEELKPSFKAQNVNHFKVCFVDTDLAMVNRTTLRDHLEQLAGSALIGGRILVVNGPPFSGKTYSKELIGYLRRALENFKLVFIDLLNIQGEVKPSDLASSIAQQLGLSDSVLPPLDQEQDSRWVEAFCNRLTGQLGDKNDPWWVVIDGFTHITLSQPVDDLVKQLATRSRMTLPGLRLVLLSYPERLPPDVERVVLREDIRPIDDRDLSNFFDQLYQERAQSPTPKDIAERIGEVRREFDPTDPRGMEKLGAVVARIAKSIGQPGGLNL
jgi:hypothetical protein